MNAFTTRNVPVVAVSSDPPADAQLTAEAVGLTFPLLADGLTAIDEWGLRNPDRPISKPATFIIDGELRPLWQWIGKDTRDRPTAVETVNALVDALPG